MKVAAIQMNTKDNKEQNLNKAISLVDQSAEEEPDLVVLPEYFSYLGPDGEKYPNSEDIPGPTINALAAKARQHSFYLLAGSILETVPDQGKCYNTSVLLDPKGEILCLYRKIHLFDVEIPGGVLFRESQTIVSGREKVIAETEFGKWGLSICIDLRYPELYRYLAKEGAWMILAPSAFSLYTGKDHWEVLLRARAIENYVYLVAPGQIGTHPPHYRTYGNSMIVDPWGTVLSRAPDVEGIITAYLDKQRVDHIRSQMPSPFTST